MPENENRKIQNKTSENSETESDPYKDWDNERMEEELRHYIESWTPEDQTQPDDAGNDNLTTQSDEHQSERSVSQPIPIDDL